MIKAEELPLGTIVRLPLDHENFPGLGVVKQNDWTINAIIWGTLGQPGFGIAFTDQELDIIGYEIERLPEGHKIEDYDQGVKFLNYVRRLDSGDFLKLMGFLERLGEDAD